MSKETWYPKAHRMPITTLEFFNPRAHDAISIVDHITDGEDSRWFLQNANNGSSVHFLIREENGVAVVYQFMPLEYAAWGNGIWSEANPYMPAWIRALLPDLRANKDNINHYTISIEHERKWPFVTTLPLTMKAATIELQTWLCKAVPTIVVDRDHLIGHYQIDHIRKANCPGGKGGGLFPFNDIIAAIRSENVGSIVLNGCLISGAIYTEWAKLGIPTHGLPITNQEPMDFPGVGTLQVQWFERSRLELHPDGTVTHGRVGAEAHDAHTKQG
jgi:hypothetical protein